MDSDRGRTDTGASTTERDSLLRLLGGRASALDASLPPVAFGLGWVLSGESIAAAGISAIAVGAVIGVWRLVSGARPLAVLFSLLAVLLGSIIALRTGQAVDFYLIRLGSNAVSGLAWMISIAVRWPLLGLVVGTLLGQRTRWRRDPDLLRAYSRASWIWVGQYVTRLAVFVPLWMLEAVVPLSIAQVVLTWPLVVLCVVVSWWVLRRTLPPDHPGIRHARRPAGAVR
ncbi:hypothetical protein IL38_18745 [Actinopolyspora erythraea]|uniref:DUF3159 domain-containing protein n=1 Tax=Actinopolyspora erythraea TaxID=414996 RepID=A0ABR4X0Q0_9ACTN|nr:DUF3159 domain-containing protein [Actinopolyspora erythraea]KGI80183.1 hypothetical protein IL38_18745 [Actinopolyspora erythraea]